MFDMFTFMRSIQTFSLRNAGDLNTVTYSMYDVIVGFQDLAAGLNNLA